MKHVQNSTAIYSYYVVGNSHIVYATAEWYDSSSDGPSLLSDDDVSWWFSSVVCTAGSSKYWSPNPSSATELYLLVWLSDGSCSVTSSGTLSVASLSDVTLLSVTAVNADAVVPESLSILTGCSRFQICSGWISLLQIGQLLFHFISHSSTHFAWKAKKHNKT